MRRAPYGKLRTNLKKLALGPQVSIARFKCRRMKYEHQGKRNPKKQMRSGPATQTAFVRGFLLCLVTAWWRNDCFSPTALQRSAAFAKAGCLFVIVRSRTGNRCGVQRSCPAPKSRMGEEGRNARATN